MGKAAAPKMKATGQVQADCPEWKKQRHKLSCMVRCTEWSSATIWDLYVHRHTVEQSVSCTKTDMHTAEDRELTHKQQRLM